MLLHDTPYPLILKALQDEEEKVAFFRKKEGRTAEKTFVRQRLLLDNFPLIHHCLYRVPTSRNTYLVWFAAYGENDLRSGNLQSDAALLLNDNCGKLSVYTLARAFGPAGGNDMLCIYTSHFFSRYRERFHWGDGLSTNDLICRFFLRNGGLLAELDFGKMNSNAGQYRNGASFQARDGVVFVSVQKAEDDRGKPFDIIRFNTFVGFDQLESGQTENIFSRGALRRAVFDEIRKKKQP